MKLRAVIFDVYSTLLDVGPAPVDAGVRWTTLFQEVLGGEPALGGRAFSVACDQVIERRHTWARARGIPWPEIQWPSVVMEVLPELAAIPPSQREEFLFQQIQCGRTLRLPAEVATTLRWLQQRGTPLGIASNAQAYSLRELREALHGHALDLDLFAADLRFWSFENGFSKPDPHVFQHLGARLEARGIPAEHVLMVGDRLDNDIEPARAFGWQTWHLSSASPEPGGGPWPSLLAHLQSVDVE